MEFNKNFEIFMLFKLVLINDKVTVVEINHLALLKLKVQFCV